MTLRSGYNIWQIMLVVAMTAVAILPIVELIRTQDGDKIFKLIALDFVVLPIVAIIWNRRAVHDPVKRHRNRRIIWVVLLLSYACFLAWMFIRTGMNQIIGPLFS